jgi:uroporphyrin-III C-methyltransferase/precorrin-2 dehydrogenase/sirohydrochlorin ferrochelatase
VSERYALSLDLEGRRVLVAGGGPVAARRVHDLIRAGALVDLVAPEVCEDLSELSERGLITWLPREVTALDVTQPARAWLVHLATGDRDTDAAIAAEAERHGIWSVQAGRAAVSAAWRPAVATGTQGTAAEGLQVAVTGGDPARSRAVRDAVLAGLDSGTLPVRRVRPSATEPVGSVALVGGGPGDEGLLTVRGRALLAAADVIVADRLGPRSVLRRLSPDVEIIDVGKTPGNHPVPQERINAILVDRARQGRRVVRLKGGDPFVLGRGGEEALHCAAHGIPVEVVPGVTSAVSVPAAAGIPVTHRGITTSFVVASAHAGADEALAALVDAPRDSTLVLLMGISALAETTSSLIASGRAAMTPVAVIESGWTPEQRTTVTTLADAATDAHAAGVTSPAVVVIGEVVALRAELGDLVADSA